MRNVTERLLLLAATVVGAEDVALALPKTSGDKAAIGTLSERVESFEKSVLLNELKLRSYRMAKTARPRPRAQSFI